MRQRKAAWTADQGAEAMDRLKGKVAIITGGASGLGRATAVRMAEESAAVAILDLQEDAGAALAEELAARQLTARHWRCDVAKEADVERVFGEVVAAFGRLDIVVNNAGVPGANKPTHELSEEEWDFVQSINTKGVFFGTKHAIAHMRRAGGGSIINISSICGLVGAGIAPPYHAAKGAVRLMAKNDALIYAADRIRVNSIHPGFMLTPMMETSMAHRSDADARRAAIVSRTPLGHMGEADDIAWGAVYLASDEAKFVTGAELVIDGGYTAQ
jgi:NAD(P)-dependent dehydrogenase (short-subunit alcohol dehydrogenase family)